MPTDRPIDGQSIMLIKDTSDGRNDSIKWMFSVSDNFDGSYNAAISGDQYKVFASYKREKLILLNCMILSMMFQRVLTWCA